MPVVPIGYRHWPLKVRGVAQLYECVTDNFRMKHTENFLNQCHSHYRVFNDPAPPRRIVACSLAQEVARRMNATPEMENNLIDTALLVGAWLVEQGSPGRWDRVSPRRILTEHSYLFISGREEFLDDLIKLLGFAGLARLIPVDIARSNIKEILQLTENQPAQEQAKAMLRDLSCGVP
jgi:hypothetical protein